MRLLNYREGFACNSSSTHSIVFSDRPPGDDDVASGFGWNRFIASSEEAKRHWLAATIHANLMTLGASADTAEALTRSLAGVYDADAYVDHQSSVALPRSWSGFGLDMTFVRDLRDWLLDPRCFIVGGNDNDDDPQPLPEGNNVGYRSAMIVDAGPSNLVARRDSAGYWTLFNRDHGSKTRFAFGDVGMDIVVKRSDAPELCDLKLTGYCTYDCPACYQGSDRSGKHGDTYAIQRIISMLADARCFEIAFGGGEPTLHPDFVNIVKHTRHVGIVPNFTTRDYRWFLRLPEVVEHIGAVAVSCDDSATVNKTISEIEKLSQPLRDTLMSKLTIQHVLGLQDEYDTKAILSACGAHNVRCVLLGYKTTGRGASQKPKTPQQLTWGEWIAKTYTARGQYDKAPLPRLGVDTVLAAEMKGVVPDHLLTTREGQFSCYVDATPTAEHRRPTIHASSFTNGREALRRLRDPVYFEDKQSSSDNPLLDAWKKIEAYEPESAYEYVHDTKRRKGKSKRLDVVT